MRVLNDKQETTEPSELGFLTIAAHAILTAFGIASLALGPLPMILSHVRLADPWPKITALFGAVIAVTVLEVPLPFAVVGFILGLFVSDGVWKEWKLWNLLTFSLGLAVIVAVVLLVSRARLENLTPGAYWTAQVDGFIAQLQESFRAERDFKWDVIRGVLLYEGPFLYLSGVLLSVWLSLGLAAHMGWLPSTHALSGDSLRAVQLPFWVSLVFGVLLIGSLVGPSDVRRLSGGFFRIVSCLMLVQGSISLSGLLNRRGLSPRVRTLVYCIAMTIGVYALVGMGVMSPLLFKKRLFYKELEDVT